MDWTTCLNKRIAKEVHQDKNLISSEREIAAEKVESANALPDRFHHGKISLLYDALRSYLECLALENGYKIYNHECCTAFLKEVLKRSPEGNQFDEMRKIRNGINYYGKKVSPAEAHNIIKELKELIGIFRK
jgi:deoxyribodipyrimidine photolyase-like uncharacterized protein